MSGIPLTKDEILKYARRYEEGQSMANRQTEEQLRTWFRQHKYLNRNNFLKLCLWKSSRPKKYYKSVLNSDERVKYITSLALTSSDEYFKIMVLQLLEGVSMPVASVILHFAQPNQYPILDFRALWSLKLQQPKKYTYQFWINYVRSIRELAKRFGLPLRVLDQGFWQYSKENQHPS